MAKSSNPVEAKAPEGSLSDIKQHLEAILSTTNDHNMSLEGMVSSCNSNILGQDSAEVNDSDKEATFCVMSLLGSIHRRLEEQGRLISSLREFTS